MTINMNGGLFMRKETMKKIKRAVKASKHNYKENHEMFIGLLR
jgi:hypothetical protein